MALVYRELRQQNRTADAMTVFYTLMSSAQRRAVFDQAQENERRTLARYIRREVNMAAKDIDRDAGRNSPTCAASISASATCCGRRTASSLPC